jgi:predicted RNA-binding protein associated with RNAse of E/G family
MLPEGWDGAHALVEWLGLGVLRVHRRGQPWSVWRWLDADREWSDDFYVNLEDPWRRTSIGFDSGDWILDLVAREDRSWRYKDEDELAWVESTGAASAEWAERARAAAIAAIADIESWAWPFCADWHEWLPPRGAVLPSLPDEWARIDEPGTGA